MTDVQSQKAKEAKGCIHNILFQTLLDAFHSLASSSELERMALKSDDLLFYYGISITDTSNKLREIKQVTLQQSQQNNQNVLTCIELLELQKPSFKR